MIQLLGQAVYVFCGLLEICIMFYIILSWLPNLKGFKFVVFHILNPFFGIIQFFMNRSIFHSAQIDFTPLVGLILLMYIRSMIGY